jgi:hypothetical protein
MRARYINGKTEFIIHCMDCGEELYSECPDHRRNLTPGEIAEMYDMYFECHTCNVIYEVFAEKFRETTEYGEAIYGRVRRIRSNDQNMP